MCVLAPANARTANRMKPSSDDEQHSVTPERSAPRGYDSESSLGPYYDDTHRLPFRRRGGFARWYGKHGRSGDVEQWRRRARVPEALGASGFSINGAAKIVGCSWHTLHDDLRVISGHQRSPKLQRWLERERKKMQVIKWRMAGKTFREISQRAGVPLSTCHRWWHFEMGD